MKRIVCLLLSIIMLMSMNVSATFEQIQDEEIVRTNTECFLSAVGSSQTITSKASLYNCFDDAEAFLFILSEGGFVVVSNKDGHVIEYSPDGSQFLENAVRSGKLYYGGPQTFLVKDENKYIDVFSRCEFVFFNSVISNVNSMRAIIIGQTRGSYLTAPTNYVAATNGWWCPITAVTNLLQYYKDHKGYDVYPGAVSNVYALRKALNGYSPFSPYIVNAPIALSALRVSHQNDGGITFAGLQSFFYRSDVNTLNSVVTMHTGNKVKNQIENGRPVLLHINTSSISSGATGGHIVMCYAYWETSQTTYYIVNNTWGSNGVYICADDVPSYYEMLYLY